MYPTNVCHFGDCRDSMRQMISDGVKVQTCVTSPPYFGLRSYLPESHQDKQSELGLESTPQQYVENMVGVFRLVRELLSDDGTLWLNLGDSYAANRGYQVPSTLMNGDSTNHAQAGDGHGMKASSFGLKPKDLIGIPWRLAFALQADGWYLRQDLIWKKPNPMPESVTDRCTKAHEYLFLLSKSERYYFDQEAIKERAITAGEDRGGGKKGAYEYDRTGDERYRTKAGLSSIGITPETRNKRSVWTVATQPFTGSHFATFPPALIEPCILAGSRPGDIVFDPFLGSGTTAQVSQDLGRQWLGCELNKGYFQLQNARTRQSGLALMEAI